MVEWKDFIEGILQGRQNTIRAGLGVVIEGISFSGSYENIFLVISGVSEIMKVMES